MVRAHVSLALLALAGTASAQLNLGGKPWNRRDSVSYSTLTSGLRCSYSRPGFQVLDSENDLQNFWRGLTGQSPVTAPRGTDWKRERVFAIMLGERPSGGYSVVVDSIERSNLVGIIHASELTPLRSQWVSEQVTTPYILVRIDRNIPQLRLDLQKRRNNVSGGVTIVNPGGVVINPDNYDRIGGGGTIDPRNSVDWRSFRSGDESAIHGSGLLVMGSEAEYQNYRGRSGARGSRDSSSGVDWRQYRLVALHLGERPATGFHLVVIDVERRGQMGIIHAVEETPVAGSRVERRPTYPYTLILVPRTIANFQVDLNQREGNGDVRIIGGRRRG